MIRKMATAIFVAGICGLSGGAQAELLGDATRGETLFRDCASCHQVGPGAKNRVGPHLNDIFGRKCHSPANHIVKFTNIPWPRVVT